MKRYIKSGVTSSKRLNIMTAKKESKQLTELVLQGNYGYGWDDLTYYDDTPEGRREMKEDYKAYAENEGIPLRTIKRKVDNPNYRVPENNITYADAIAWIESCPYDTSELYGQDGKNFLIKQIGSKLGDAQIFVYENDTVYVYNVNTNRTKQVYSIDELEKAVNKIMR